jgi:hypothetical protein
MKAHDIGHVTATGPRIDDPDILSATPEDLSSLLRDANGFILYHGGLHVRGAVISPAWHSLRHAIEGPEAFHRLYDAVLPTDIPFAQDCFGDQFLLRDGAVFRLEAETGEIEETSANLGNFFSSVSNDAFEFLSFDADLRLEPGQLMHAYPPFCVERPESGYSLKAVPALELIQFHADFAKQISNVPESGQVQVRIVD